MNVLPVDCCAGRHTSSIAFNAGFLEVRDAFQMSSQHSKRVRRGHEKCFMAQNHVAILRNVTTTIKLTNTA